MSQTPALFLPDPRAAQIARQLRAQQVAAARIGSVIPAEYIDDFARKIVQIFGVDDLRQITPRWRYVQVERETEQSSGTWGEVLAYDTPAQPWQEIIGEDGTVFSLGGSLYETVALPAVHFALSSDERMVYWLKWFDPPGVVVGSASPVRSPGSIFQITGQVLRDLAPIIGAAVTFGGIGSIINTAIFSSATVAAYPAATSAFSNFVLQTALTGGDIEAAARSAAASLTGAQFGDVVGTGLDSAQIGKVAAAATSAALQGGDVDKAVLRSLVDLGAQSMDDWIDTPGDFSMPVDDYIDPGLFGDSGDWLTPEDLGITVDLAELSETLALNQDAFDVADVDPASLYPDEFGNLFLPSGEYVELSDVAFIDSIYMDADGNIRAPDNSILIPSSEALDATADELSAEIARQMDAGADKTQNAQPAPPSRPAAIPPAASQTKWPTIVDATKALDSIGRLAAQLRSTATAVQGGTYRPPAGSTSSTGTPRNTPVGVPVTLSDGRVVVNNGNGTQTIRTPDGRITTTQSSYAGATGGARASVVPGVSNQVLLLGGAALVVGALLLARRR